MLISLLFAALGASEPQSDISPRTPGTIQAPAVRALLPQDEGWRAVDETTPVLKDLNFGSDDTLSVSFGIDTRFHYEQFENEAFGALPGSDDSLFFLATPWASLSYNDHVRVYGALKHASIEGREGPQPGAINDELDLHQGFVEFALGDTLAQSRNDLLLRAGRQELHYGAGRLIAIRGGRFIRDDYDGALVRYRNGSWVTDVFGVFGVEDGNGVFDNGTDDSMNLSGVYSSGRFRNTNVDLYGVRWERDSIATLAGPSEIVRTYLGARMSGTAFQNWTYEVETTVQFGSVDASDEDIRGFQFGGRIARPLQDLPGSPTPTIEFLYSTGDDDPTDGRIDTFLAPAASGLVYEDVTQPLGPGNLTWIKGSVPFKVGDRLSVSPYVHGYWRNHDEDALYTLFNTEFLSANSGNGDFVGLDIGATARFSVTEHLAVIAYGSLFDAGNVFAGSGRNASGSSAMLGLSFKY